MRRADAGVNEVEQDANELTAEESERHPRLGAIAALIGSVMREQSAEQVGLAAAGAAFWLVISALPTLIAVVSVFGLAVSPERVADDLGALASYAPGSLGGLLTQQLREVSASDPAGLSLGFAISFVLAVWSASAGIWNLDRAIREAYGLPPQRYVEGRARALLGALVVVFMLGLAAFATSIPGARDSAIVDVVGVPVELVAVTVGVGALYRFAIGRPVALRRLIPGAVTSAIGVLLASAAFAAYIALSTRYTAVYGAFAGVVIGMLAVYLAVYVVLLGAVLNMELERLHAERANTRSRWWRFACGARRVHHSSRATGTVGGGCGGAGRRLRLAGDRRGKGRVGVARMVRGWRHGPVVRALDGCLRFPRFDNLQADEQGLARIREACDPSDRLSGVFDRIDRLYREESRCADVVSRDRCLRAEPGRSDGPRRAHG